MFQDLRVKKVWLILNDLDFKYERSLVTHILWINTWKLLTKFLILIIVSRVWTFSMQLASIFSFVIIRFRLTWLNYIIFWKRFPAVISVLHSIHRIFFIIKNHIFIFWVEMTRARGSKCEVWVLICKILSEGWGGWDPGWCVQTTGAGHVDCGPV